MSDAIITVIIPVHEDAAGLHRTLNSLERQEGFRDALELIVVANRCSPIVIKESRRLVSSFGRGSVIHEDRAANSYLARNSGLRHAHAELVLFLDAGIIVPSDMLASTVATVQGGIDYLGFQVGVFDDSPTLFSIYNMITGFPVLTYFKKRHFAPTCALAVRTSVFEALGNFDDRLESGGDLEFGNRVWSAGFHQELSPLKVAHPARATWGELARKYRRVARGHAGLFTYHKPIFSRHIRHIYTMNSFRPPRPRTLMERAGAVGYKLTVTQIVMLMGLHILLSMVRAVSFLAHVIGMRRTLSDLG